MLKFRLKDFMDESGLSIQTVANRTGISRTTISSFYNDKSGGIQFETLDKLASGLGVEIDELFENVFPDENLRYSLDRIPETTGMFDEDEPTFTADFFYTHGASDDGVTVIEFRMPLLVTLNTVDALHTMTIFLSHEELGQGWQENANEHKLKDFLAHTSNESLEPYLISISAEIYRQAVKQGAIEDNCIVVFKSDAADFPESAGTFPIIYSWPGVILKQDKTMDAFLKAKYLS